MHTTETSLSTDNMAAMFRSTNGTERTLAIPSGLTHEEAVAYAMQYCGANECLAQFVAFS